MGGREGGRGGGVSNEAVVCRVFNAAPKEKSQGGKDAYQTTTSTRGGEIRRARRPPPFLGTERPPFKVLTALNTNNVLKME